MRAWLFALATIIALAHSASGAPVTGELTASSLALPSDSSTQGEPFAGLATGHLTGASLTARGARLSVIEYEQGYATLGAANLGTPAPAPRFYNFSNAVLKTGDVDSGVSTLGIYPRGGTTMTANGPTTTESRAHSVISDLMETSADTDRWRYFAEITEPHILLSAGGTVQISGPGAIKIRGPTVVIDSDTGRMTFETGSEQSSPAETKVRWLVIDADALTATFETGSARFVAAIAQGQASWNGTATVHHPTGRLYAGGSEYEARAASTTIGGKLNAALAADPTAKVARLRIALSGDMQTTALAATPVPTPPIGFGLNTWGLLLVGAVLFGGSALAIALKKRVDEFPRTDRVNTHPLDQAAAAALLAQAEEAEEEAQWERAADLFGRARRVDIRNPENPRFAIQEGIYRRRAGQHEAAIAAFAEAMRAMTTGQAEWFGTLTALEWGAPDLAEEYLVRGLMHATDPTWLALLIRSVQKDFSKLQDRSEVQRALADAEARAATLNVEAGDSVASGP